MAGGTLNGVGRQLERLFTSGTVTGLSEGQLLDRFVTRQDEAAFEALVARHGPMVLGVCRRMLRDPNDVDDAFQATFLVLVRKAGSLRQRELLGNWLYGVAFKIAVRARATVSRRHASETPDVEGLAQRPSNGGPEPALHEEVHHLPEKYRLPVVLCYLEGLTHDEAAARLSWPVGTVKGRLARARELLRSRLVRRGVTVASMAALPVLLSRDASAAVSPVLLNTTLQAAAHVAAGKAVGVGLTSANALALSDGAINATMITNLKITAVTLGIGILFAGAGVSAYQQSGRGSGVGGATDVANISAATGHAETTPVANPPDDLRRAMEGQIASSEAPFAILISRQGDWNEHRLDRLFHWSRAAKEAEEYFLQVDPRLAEDPKIRRSRPPRSGTTVTG